MHIEQQLLTLVDEKAILLLITYLEEFCFPPYIQHIKGAVDLLKEIEWDNENTIGKN